MPDQQMRQGLLPLPLPEMLGSPATSLEASVPRSSPGAWQLLFTPTTEASPAEPQFHIGQQPLLPLPEVPPLPSAGSGGANSSCAIAAPTTPLQSQQQQPQQQCRKQQDLPAAPGGRDRCRKSLS